MKRSLLVVALALVIGACGGTKDTGFNNLPTPTNSPTGGGAAEIRLVAGNRFEPQTFQAKAGEAVTWRNADPSQPHNVVADDGSYDSNPNCLADQTKCMPVNGIFTHTFSAPGTYPYYCVIHGTKGGVGMAGTVVVT